MLVELNGSINPRAPHKRGLQELLILLPLYYIVCLHCRTTNRSHWAPMIEKPMPAKSGGWVIWIITLDNKIMVNSPSPTSWGFHSIYVIFSSNGWQLGFHKMRTKERPRTNHHLPSRGPWTFLHRWGTKSRRIPVAISMIYNPLVRRL